MKLTIHLLHDDQPTGARIAKIDQWSGRAVCAPRSALDEVLRRSELDGPCLYFLISQPPTRHAPRHCRFKLLPTTAKWTVLTYTGEDEEAGKYKLFLKGEPIVLQKPVKLGKNVHLKPQGPKYAKLDDILKARTLDDVFSGS